MTHTEALTLRPGDYVRLRPDAIWRQTLPRGDTFVILRIQRTPHLEIVTMEGFRFTPEQVDGTARRKRP